MSSVYRLKAEHPKWGTRRSPDTPSPLYPQFRHRRHWLCFLVTTIINFVILCTSKYYFMWSMGPRVSNIHHCIPLHSPMVRCSQLSLGLLWMLIASCIFVYVLSCSFLLDTCLVFFNIVWICIPMKQSNCNSFTFSSLHE